MCEIKKCLYNLQYEMEEGKEFSFHCVLSCLSMTVGLAIISSSIAAGLAGTKILYGESLLCGFLVFTGGFIVLMLTQLAPNT